MFDLSVTQGLVKRFSGGFVLAFHDLSAERFAELVDGLRPAQPVGLAEIVQRTKAAKPTSGLFAITVDDGVGDTVRRLAGVCRQRAWPVTFYLPTQYVSTGEGMPFQWWRQIRPLLPARRVELSCGVFDFARPNEVERMSRLMETLWHTARPETYLPSASELLEVVLRERGITRASLQPAAPITWPEAAELARCELIEFESHGVSHVAMSVLDDIELAGELKHSRDLVSERAGRECRHLAYPFGSPASIGSRAPAAAARFYDSAVTMTLAGVDSADPWRLPRIPLYPENSTFMARLKILLKCRATPGERSGRAAA